MRCHGSERSASVSLRTRTEGTLAVQTGTFRLEPPGATPRAPGAHSATSERVGKYVLVLNRVGEEWRICWDLWNPDQPAG